MDINRTDIGVGIKKKKKKNIDDFSRWVEGYECIIIIIIVQLLKEYSWSYIKKLFITCCKSRECTVYK